MAPRNSEAEVREIIETDLDATGVNAFLAAADLLVTEELVGQGMSDARLKEIERYLCAHLITIRDPDAGRITARKALEASASYGGQTGKGFDASHYGQTALALDASGKLGSLSADSEAATFSVIEGR